MRRLHAVGKHEEFVASGIYEFEQDGAKIGRIEYWSIHEVGGAQFIRVDMDGREWDGRSILYEALRNPQGQIERVDLRAYGSSQDVVKQVRASYTFFDDRVECIRVVSKNSRFEEDITMPAGYAIHLGSQLLYGFIIPHVNEAQVKVITIDNVFSDPELAFKGYELTTAAMQFRGEEQIDLGEKSYSARLYQTADERVWLDPFDILLREESASSKVMLEQYARRPEPKTHD